MAWSASFSEDERRVTVKRPSGSHIYFKADKGSSNASPIGSSRKLDYHVQLLNGDITPNTEGTPAYMDMALPDGMILRFSTSTGEIFSVITSAGHIISAEEYAKKVQVTYNQSGSLNSVYSQAQGLMRSIPGNNSLSLEWYAPENVSASHDGEFVVTGEPYKTALYETSVENGATVTRITNQRAGQEPHFIERREEGNKVSIIKGEGDERILRTIERNALPDSKWERIETIKGINDSKPLRSTRTVRKYTDGGWLTISYTEGYNTSKEQTTLYIYNDQFHISLEIKPDGGYTRYEYDEEGRVVLQAAPWAGGGEKATRTTYAELRFNDFRPATQMELIIAPDGTETVLHTKTYVYENGPQINRTTITETALGSNQVHTSISETYGEAAEYPYARGKRKMNQGIDGIETVYSYEAATDHDAIHKVTATTQANGSIVPGHSSKSVEYIAENGTTTRKEQYVHTGDTWSLISSENYEYDAEFKLIRTTRGNGRTSTTEWMCCGPLRETDEDGIVTSYSYNSAKQLVETIRSATESTPEIITTYTYDAAGRVLSTRRDVGAMTTEESTEYDELGRVISSTDILGRVTKTEYNDNLLTITVTTPAGATLVTKKYYDGTVLWQGGTGQREIETDLVLTEEGILTTTLSQGVILYRSLANGFSQNVKEEQPNTKGGFIVTRNSYNDKGKLVCIQTDGMASILKHYNELGHSVKQTAVLNELDPDDTTKNRISESSAYYCIGEDGIYQVKKTINYNASGRPLIQSRSQLVSSLNPALENKTISVDVYGQQSTQWVEYTAPAKRTQFNQIPTSDIVAKVIVVDGFTVQRTDHFGLTNTQRRSYTAAGVTLQYTDPRNNTTVILTDLAERVITITDAAGNTTTTAYSPHFNNPAVITNAEGKTICSTYDIRGRKTAEYGTGIYPACFAYDEANRMILMTTFRTDEEEIISDPSDRTDGDTTVWLYEDATGLELKKTYADGACILKTYDFLNRLETLTKARGSVTTHSYAPLTGELVSVTHDDKTPSLNFIYNHLGQMISVSDASGIRELSYDAYGRPNQDTSFGYVESCLQEAFDAFGRPCGYQLMIGNRVAQHSFLDYDDQGGIIGMNLEGLASPFTWEYDTANGFLAQLSYPNGMVRSNSYHSTLNLLTGIGYESSMKEGTVAAHAYKYDGLMRPTWKQDSWDATTPATTRYFGYNDRSELTSDQILSRGRFAYQYDNIGNRKTARELEEEVSYDANLLNQYTHITKKETPFTPSYDADGNQIRIKTSTGTWNVSYDANDRPVSFINEDDRTVVSCNYDYQGRRFEKKLIINGITSKHTYYLYRDYLQIAELDLMHPEPVLVKSYLWDPTELAVTRLLMMTCWKNKGMEVEKHLYFMHDALKNVTSIFSEDGERKARYEYAPFGSLLTAEGDMAEDNKYRFSCEYMDDELGLIYYNYRHLNPADGRWISRDPIAEQGGRLLYGVIGNRWGNDYLGFGETGTISGKVMAFFQSCLPGDKSSQKITIDLTAGTLDAGSWTQFYSKPEKLEFAGSLKLNDITFPLSMTMQAGEDFPTFSAGFNNLVLYKIPLMTISASGEWKQQEDDKCKASLNAKLGNFIDGLTIEGNLAGNWERGFIQEQYIPSFTVGYKTKITEWLAVNASFKIPNAKDDPKKNLCSLAFIASGETQDETVKISISLKAQQQTGHGVPPGSIGIESEFQIKPSERASLFFNFNSDLHPKQDISAKLGIKYSF